MKNDSLSNLRARLEDAVSGGGAHPPATIAELCDRFAVIARRDFAPRHGRSSEATNFRDALRSVRELYSDRSPASFGPVQLQACRMLMIEQGLARTTINARVRRIRRLFAWATSMGWLPPEVLTQLRAVDGLRAGRSGAKETAPVQPVPIELVKAAQAQMTPMHRAMIEVQLRTGMRPGELLIMRGVDIRMVDPIWTYTPQTHKGTWRGKSRVVYIGPQAQAEIRGWLRTGHLWTSPRTGEPYLTNAYLLMIYRACDRAGVPRWSPNQLRHTAATVIRREFGLEAVQACLGHAHARTSEIYAEQSAHVAIEAMRRLG